MPHERRVFIDLPPQQTSGIISPPKDISHYLFTVLRLPPHSKVTVVARSGEKVFATRVTQTPEGLALAIEHPITTEETIPVVSTLAVALCKGNTNDTICKQAVELGVKRVLIFQAGHSVAVIKSQDAAEKKLARWRKIIERAGSQAGRIILPEVLLTPSVDEAITIIQSLAAAEDSILTASLQPDSKMPGELVPVSGTAHVLIGPEGDFTYDEYQLLRQAHTIPLSLGPLRLTVETAALTAIASLQGAASVWTKHKNSSSA